MLEDDLRARCKVPVLLVGIGNTMRGDDGFGPRMVEALDSNVSASVLNVGEIPESYVGRIVKYHAKTILLLDAAWLNAAPGSVALLEVDELAGASVSTHQMPLQIFARYLQQESGADVLLLGVQPEHLMLGQNMSCAVERTVEILSGILRDVLN